MQSSLDKILLGQIFALDVSWTIGPFRNYDHQWKKKTYCVICFINNNIFESVSYSKPWCSMNVNCNFNVISHFSTITFYSTVLLKNTMWLK